MTTTLEAVPDVVERLGYPTRALRFALSRTWPFPGAQDTHNMSGLDCALVVMRHVLAHASVLDTGMSQELRDDELTMICLRDFTGDTPEKLSLIQEMRVAMFETIRDVGHFIDMKFRTLIKGTALWEELRADPYQPILCRQPGSAQWVLATDTSHSTPPSIRWETKHHATIQAAIDASFGMRTDGDGVTSALFGAAPVFLSVLYVPNGGHDADFGIQSVCEVTLPRHVPTPTPTVGQNEIVFEDAGIDWYRLIAVVRMRRPGPEEHDYVRLYDVEGNNILPLGDRSRYAGIVEDSWSLADQDRCCMLFYVRVDRPAPEGGPWIEEVHIEEQNDTTEGNDAAAANGEQPQELETDPRTPKTPNKRPLPPLMSSGSI